MYQYLCTAVNFVRIRLSFKTSYSWENQLSYRCKTIIGNVQNERGKNLNEINIILIFS